MLESRFGGGVAGLLTGLAMTMSAVGWLVKTPGSIPAPLSIGTGCGLLLIGVRLVISSMLSPSALIWRRSSSGRGYIPLARYFRSPREPHDNLCWHCGASLSGHGTICVVCGATRPSAGTILPSITPAFRSWNSTAVVPVVYAGLAQNPGESIFPLYTPDGWDQPVDTTALPAVAITGEQEDERESASLPIETDPEVDDYASGVYPVVPAPAAAVLSSSPDEDEI